MKYTAHNEYIKSSYLHTSIIDMTSNSFGLIPHLSFYVFNIAVEVVVYDT